MTAPSKTGGAWDPSDRPLYFLASQPSADRIDCTHHDCILLAVNDFGSDQRRSVMERYLERGSKILIDSGIFWLTNEHKRAHRMRMDHALALAPDEIDGFDKLWDRYLKIMQAYGDQVWGYIELDQGGMANKRRTRARLEDLGLRPIPVYHPLNDGWDYFDELAESYDRICWGNVVQAMAEVRKHFIVTCWERHRAYPDLWVHMLGLTPNEWISSYPIDSADSSQWTGTLRWEKVKEFSLLQVSGYLPDGFRYKRGRDNAEIPEEMQAPRSLAMASNTAAAMQRSWRLWQSRVLEEFDLSQYPPP